MWLYFAIFHNVLVYHFRRASDPCTTFSFKLGGNNIDIVNSYRYLGLELNETLDYTYSAQILSDAGSRALGALTFKYIRSKGLHFDTYTKLYSKHTYVFALRYKYCFQ